VEIAQHGLETGNVTVKAVFYQTEQGAVVSGGVDSPGNLSGCVGFGARAPVQPAEFPLKPVQIDLLIEVFQAESVYSFLEFLRCLFQLILIAHGKVARSFHHQFKSALYFGHFQPFSGRDCG
jgi:hypothetical protein